MDSIRQKQVGELIRRQFSMILAREGRYVYGQQALVTITQVLMTSDLALAKVYLSIYNTENKQEVILLMEDSYPRLKHALHISLKKQIRAMPEMKFYIDDTIDEVYKVDALFKKFDPEGGKIED